MWNKIAMILMVIGGLNWGSIGLFGFDFVGALFGGQTAPLPRIIFTIVGIAALWGIFMLFQPGTDETQTH